ncbi:hypothetical protein WP5S18E01_P30170 (plasmid) [Enterobacter cloacae]|nr:hypothetical protein WP5S18E01_P30170 [Enterobacter cloacae]
MGITEKVFPAIHPTFPYENNARISVLLILLTPCFSNINVGDAANLLI